MITVIPLNEKFVPSGQHFKLLNLSAKKNNNYQLFQAMLSEKKLKTKYEFFSSRRICHEIAML